MKKFKNFLLLAVIVMAGAFAAFATNAAKDSNGSLVRGFYYDESATEIKCIQTDQMCSTTPGSFCTWKDENDVTHQLSSYYNDTQCGSPLYKRSN